MENSLTKMTVPFLDLRAQLDQIREEVTAAASEAINSCSYILGGEVEHFEKAFGDFIQNEYCLGVSNGLDALKLSLEAAEIGPGDEVILPANSYIATALAVSAVGAKVVLVDCERENYNIDPKLVAEAITDKTAAIIPVHLTSQCCDMDPIMELAEKHNLIVIEDAAQAHGTSYKGQKAGTIGHFGCFSFYPGKNLGAYGDAGLVCTNSSEYYEKLKMYRNYGQRVKYHHEVKGYNHRMDEIQAAILKVKLNYLNSWNEQRQKHAEQYRSAIAHIPQVHVNPPMEYSDHVYHLFIVEVENRDAVQQYLKEQGITTLIHYPIPIHLQKAYESLGYKEGDFPVSEYLAKRILTLPMYAELKSEQIEYVCESLKSFYN